MKPLVSQTSDGGVRANSGYLSLSERVGEVDPYESYHKAILGMETMIDEYLSI